MFKRIQKSRGIQDLLVTLFSRGGAMLIGLTMQSLLAWRLGPDGRGEYAICLIFSTLGVAFFTFSMDWAVSYFIASKKKPFNQVVTFSYGIILVTAFIMWPILNKLIQMPLTFFNQASSEAFELSIFWCLSTIGFTISMGFLRGLRAFSMLAFITIAKLSYVLVITYFLTSQHNLDVLALIWSDFSGSNIYFSTQGVTAPIWADLTGNVFVFIIILISLIVKWHWRPSLPRMGTIGAMISYCSRMFGGTVGVALNLRIGTVLLAFYVLKHEIGYFALAMALLTQLGTISDAINNILTPRISSSSDGRSELVSIATRCLSTFVFVLGIIILLAADWFVPLIFSEKFIPAIELMWVLFPGMWLRSICKVLSAYFNGINKPQIITYSTIINIIFNVLLLLYCLPKWGVMGASWAFTISCSTSALFLIIMFSKKSNSNKNVFVINKKDIKLFYNFFKS